jgi:hypothetical protein
MAFPYGASGLHPQGTPHSVGLLRTRDQPDAQASAYNIQHLKETNVQASEGFETIIPESAAPETGKKYGDTNKIFIYK